jgi:hypothetical protein
LRGVKGCKSTRGGAARKPVYHRYAQCQSCHPAYATPEEINAASVKLTGTPRTEFRPNMYLPELKDSDYTTGAHRLQQPSPDFLVNRLRSPRDDSQRADLYRVLVAGVPGAAMPGWDPSLLPEKTSDVWVLAYYVRSLVQLRGTSAGLALRARLDAASAPRR